MNISSRSKYFVLFTLALFVVMSGSLRAVIAYAMDTTNTHASQIVLIPFVTAGLMFRNRRNIFRSVSYSIVPGAVLMALGGVLLVAGMTVGVGMETGNYLAIMASATVVLWQGGFLLFYGTEAFKTAMFPLLFLVFFIPIPIPVLNQAIYVLQRGSADMSFVLLKLSGTPILREGFVFRLPNLSIEVAPECSGIRSGISILISSLLAGHLFLRSYWKRIALVLIAVPVLIFKNALRIGTLSYLAIHFDPRILTSELHREGGIPFFVLGLLLLYPVLAILMKSESKSRRLI
jgi:exosortase